MRYDLDLLSEFCREIGLLARMADPSTLEVIVGDDAVLCFQNAEREEDCLMGFLDTPWHTHGDLMFADPRGYYIELDPLNVLTGLRGGEVLVCELQKEGVLIDRWLLHSEYNDFKHMQPGERITVRRADTTKVAEAGGVDC
jgi:hypothetical protein